ncbi:MAG: hypothetical protein JXB26_05335 [Candidatus Aminicenantes bacterium]|nr:hypothetical protein [Candidatus Aminicenantes bacterium]
MPRIKVISGFDIKIDRKKVLYRIGYKSKDLQKKTPLFESFEYADRRFPSLIYPAAVTSLLEAHETNGHPIFTDAKKVALCVCTIGPNLESAVETHVKNNELLYSLVLDGFGSEAVETLARQCAAKISKEAESLGYRSSKRFSPGYKKWPLEQQAFVFEKVPANRIGVHLTPRFMMIPRKSISFRINFYDS